MGRVYIFFEMTDSKVISAPLSVRKSEFSQDFCRIGVNFKCLPSLCMSFSQWSNFYEILNFLTVENLTRKFKSH